MRSEGPTQIVAEEETCATVESNEKEPAVGGKRRSRQRVRLRKGKGRSRLLSLCTSSLFFDVLYMTYILLMAYAKFLYISDLAS